MDIELQQTSNCEKFQSEDETFCIVNKILEELIDEVENLVRSNEYQNGLSVERSHLSVNGSQPDSQNFIPNIVDSLRNHELENRPCVEQRNLSDLSDEGIYLQSKSDSPKSTENQSRSSLDESVPNVEEGRVDNENYQEDLRNTALISGSAFGQPDMSSLDVQTNYEDDSDSDSSNEDFVDVLESVDPIDVRADSFPISPNNEQNLDDDSDESDEAEYLFAVVPMDEDGEEEVLENQPPVEIGNQDNFPLQHWEVVELFQNFRIERMVAEFFPRNPPESGDFSVMAINDDSDEDE